MNSRKEPICKFEYVTFLAEADRRTLYTEAYHDVREEGAPTFGSALAAPETINSSLFKALHEVKEVTTLPCGTWLYHHLQIRQHQLQHKIKTDPQLQNSSGTSSCKVPAPSVPAAENPHPSSKSVRCDRLRQAFRGKVNTRGCNDARVQGPEESR